MTAAIVRALLTLVFTRSFLVCGRGLVSVLLSDPVTCWFHVLVLGVACLVLSFPWHFPCAVLSSEDTGGGVEVEVGVEAEAWTLHSVSWWRGRGTPRGSRKGRGPGCTGTSLGCPTF